MIWRRFENWNFDENNLTERFTEVISLPGTDLREPQYASLDVGRYLGLEGVEARALPVDGRRLVAIPPPLASARPHCSRGSDLP